MTGLDRASGEKTATPAKPAVNLLRGGGPLLRIGHRGAAALAPENTIESVEAALEAGVDAVELDLFAEPDGTLVLGHSRKELGAEPVTVEAMFEFLADRAPEIPVLTDLKFAGREQELLDALLRHGLLGRAVACTSHVGVLRRLRGIEPSLARSRTYSRGRVLWARRLALPFRVPRIVGEVGASALTLSRRVVSRAAVERCHELGVAVLVWTVNDRALVKQLDDLGVDGIITDDPHVFAG